MKVNFSKVVLTAVSGAIATGFSLVGFVVAPGTQFSLTKQDNPFNTELHNNCHENCAMLKLKLGIFC